MVKIWDVKMNPCLILRPKRRFIKNIVIYHQENTLWEEIQKITYTILSFKIAAKLLISAKEKEISKKVAQMETS